MTRGLPQAPISGIISSWRGTGVAPPQTPARMLSNLVRRVRDEHPEVAAGCLECSCERFNRYLDRALVVPSIGHPAELAYFAKRP